METISSGQPEPSRKRKTLLSLCRWHKLIRAVGTRTEWVATGIAKVGTKASSSNEAFVTRCRLAEAARPCKCFSRIWGLAGVCRLTMVDVLRAADTKFISVSIGCRNTTFATPTHVRLVWSASAQRTTWRHAPRHCLARPRGARCQREYDRGLRVREGIREDATNASTVFIGWRHKGD